MREEDSKDLEAAHDFRAQQQKRYGKQDPRITIKKGMELLPAFLEHARVMLPDLTMSDLLDGINAYSPQTEFDEPFSGARIDDLRQLIEAAAEKCQFGLRQGVSTGAMDSDGLEAMQQKVMLTESSVILVTSTLLIMINRLAKLLARSLPIETLEGEQFRAIYEISKIEELLMKDENLQHAWTSFFADYGMSPEKPFHGNVLFVLGDERQTLWDDFSDAIGLFVLGHEYGHHIDAHSLGDEAGADGEAQEEQHQKELIADMIGSFLTLQAGQATERPNWCALTNVGAVVILTVLELNRRAHHILLSGSDETSPTRVSHPPLEERLKVIKGTAREFFGGKDPSVAFAMQDCVYELLMFVWKHVTEFLKEMHAGGTRPIVPDRGGWLPS